MSTTIVNSIFLPVHFKTGSEDRALKSGKDDGEFFHTILKSINPAQNKSFHTPSKPSEAESTLKNGTYSYLESLRKALLGKGKSLSKISIQNKDLFVLKKFLCSCGFSQGEVERLFEGLLQNNPRGEINLAQFFDKITELASQKKTIDQSIALEPAAIPHLESALRDFGLTPKEVEHVFSGARLKGGGLDLNRFVIKLKEISNQIKGRNQVDIDQNLVHQISRKLEKIGIQIPDNGKDARISINKLITALEKMTGGSGKGNQLPTDVKATIDQILGKVVIANEKNGPQSPLFSFSKLRFNNLHPKEKMDKKGKRLEKESLLSPSKEKGGISAKNGQQKIESPFSSKGAKLFSDLNAGNNRPPRPSSTERVDIGSGFNRETTEEGNMIRSETRMMDVPQNISSSTFSDSINTGKQNAGPVRGFLPGYLIDQVGRQISRAIMRGERVIRLQLKPPDLGTLRVEMDMKGNVLKLGMIAENSSVKELLLSNVYELREALAEQGVKLERLDININYNFDHSLANSKEGLNGGKRQGQDINEVPFMPEDDAKDHISGPWNMEAGNRLLDLVA